MPVILDFSSFTATEKTQLLTAAKAELLRRAGLGSVQTGSSTGESYGLQKMSEDGLIRMINSLSESLGLTDGGSSQTRPNFAGRYCVSPTQCP